MMHNLKEIILEAPALRWLLALSWIGLVVLLLLQPSGRPVVGPTAPPGPPDLGRELYLMTGHIVAFSVMTALLWWALAAWLGRTRALLMTVVIVLTLGGLTELAQTQVIDRTASLFDLFVNAAVTLITTWLIKNTYLNEM